MPMPETAAHVAVRIPDCIGTWSAAHESERAGIGITTENQRQCESLAYTKCPYRNYGHHLR